MGEKYLIGKIKKSNLEKPLPVGEYTTAETHPSTSGFCVLGDIQTGFIFFGGNK